YLNDRQNGQHRIFLHTVCLVDVGKVPTAYASQAVLWISASSAWTSSLKNMLWLGMDGRWPYRFRKEEHHMLTDELFEDDEDEEEGEPMNFEWIRQELFRLNNLRYKADLTDRQRAVRTDLKPKLGETER